MLKFLILLFSLFFACLTAFSNAVGNDISFSHLTTKEGLSHYSVLALYQDERGFIWMGTREGLNVYDGASMSVYKVEKGSANSINSNYIKGIAGNNNGKIYIWNTVGIVEYDIRKEVFTTLYSGDVSAIFFEKKLYISSGNQLFYIDEQTGKFELYYQFEDEKLIIQAISSDGKNLLIGTNEKGMISIASDFTIKNLTRKLNVLSIYYGLRGRIWIGTTNNGLFCLDNNDSKNYQNNSLENSICSNYIRTLCEDDNGNLWIGTFDGLSKLNIQKETFTNYFADGEPGSISNNSIWGLIKDHQGTIWFGTYYGGVNYFNPEYEIFTNYRPNETASLGPSSFIIGEIIEDKHKNVWICTDGGGLNKYDPQRRLFKSYQYQEKENSISHNNTKNLYYDDQNDVLWIGTHLGGLNKLDLKTEKFTHYLHLAADLNSIPSNIIYDIEQYKNELIVATKNGVCFFNEELGGCTKQIKNELINVVVDLHIDHYGVLWMSVDNGLASYDIDTEELRYYLHNDNAPRSLSNNSVNRIFLDSWNQLWICTLGGGLDMYDYQQDNFHNYDVSNSEILSNVVYNIEEYSPGKLMLSTDEGISLLDSKRGSFINYKFDDDLPISNINNTSICINERGQVYVGTTKGMLTFDISKLEFKKKSFNIYPYKLQVNGKEVKPSGKDGILRDALQYTPKIELKNTHKVFEIQIAVTNYISANKPTIRHKLLGFDEDWIYTNNQNRINYFNLNSGDYQLVVEAIGNSNEVLAHTDIVIKVLPPFYKTTIAYIIYFLLLSSIVYIIFNVYSSRIRLQESLKYERKHIDDIKELNQNKLHFFSNISHELLTPLTLIIGQLEILVTSFTFTPTVYNKIISTYRNSKQMQGLISDLLDFRKHESGKMQLNVVKSDISTLLQEAYLLFEQYSDTRNIKLIYQFPEESIQMWFDPKQLLKVINNLLSNAFKHTKSGGKIEIELIVNENRVLIKIKDTGTGIKEQELNKIFDRFYQGKLSKGTGIGLALAKGIVELHGGTIYAENNKEAGACFIIELLKGKDHFDESLIQQEKDIIMDHFEPEVVELAAELDVENEEEIKKSGDKPKIKILIIEDNDAIREMLCDIFDGIYQVISAENGLIGLELVKKENPSIILSDIVMPKMSGTELCKEIKSNIDTCHIPVVLLTARTTSEHYMEGLKYGADDYITKPFNANILVSRCNNLVKSRLVLQEKYSRQLQASPKVLATNELDKKFIDKCLVIIDKYLDDPKFNVQLFSQELGMARTKLFNKIKAITGQTPNEFLISFRLKKAAYMLINNPEYSIADISVFAGFSSSRYFSKAFKDKYHKSPITYRKEKVE